MNNLKHIASLAIIAATITGCSSSPKQALHPLFETGSCTFPNKTEQAPDWYCMPDDLFPQGYWYQKGIGQASVGDYGFQYTVATQNARIDLARRATVQTDNEFFQRIVSEGVANSQEVEALRTDVAKVSNNLVVPTTTKAAEIYDSAGNLYILLRVVGADMEEAVRKRESNLQREFNARIKREAKTAPTPAAPPESG